MVYFVLWVFGICIKDEEFCIIVLSDINWELDEWEIDLWICFICVLIYEIMNFLILVIFFSEMLLVFFGVENEEMK